MLSLKEDERKALYKMLSTDTGKQLMGLIKDLRQDYIQKALYNVQNAGTPARTHSYIAAADAIETLYYLVAPPKSSIDDDD